MWLLISIHYLVLLFLTLFIFPMILFTSNDAIWDALIVSPWVLVLTVIYILVLILVGFRKKFLVPTTHVLLILCTIFSLLYIPAIYNYLVEITGVGYVLKSGILNIFAVFSQPHLFLFFTQMETGYESVILLCSAIYAGVMLFLFHEAKKKL